MDNQHLKGECKMSKKITQEEFLLRFKRSYPDSSITPLNYTAISNPLTVRCNICGKEWTKNRAREFLNTFQCCGAHGEKRADKLKRIYEGNEEYEWIKQSDKDHYIVRHSKCGQEFERTLQAGLDNPFSCKYCEAGTQPLSTLQAQLNKDIKILNYDPKTGKTYFKCLKCGLIFIKTFSKFRGCPKCNRK